MEYSADLINVSRLEESSYDKTDLYFGQAVVKLLGSCFMVSRVPDSTACVHCVTSWFLSICAGNRTPKLPYWQDVSLSNSDTKNGPFFPFLGGRMEPDFEFNGPDQHFSTSICAAGGGRASGYVRTVSCPINLRCEQEQPKFCGKISSIDLHFSCG